MSLVFPDTVTFRGICRPCRIEADISDLEVEGDIPAAIDGTFYRTGPDPRFPPHRGDDLFIHGDGMLSMLRIRDGRASYRSRYARTPRFLAEEKAGRSLFGDYRNPFTDDPSAAGVDRGTANTNMVFHAGKLLALKEDSRMTEIDPDTLATRGYWTADGKITSRVASAHPKFDPVTGDMLTYGFQAKGIATTDLAFYVIDRNGRVANEVWLNTPYVTFMHDFVATENYAIFPVFPATTVLEKVKAGLPYYWWDPTKPTYLGVLPRNGRADEVRWYEGPPRFGFHFFNAYEEDKKIHILGCMNEPHLPPTFPVLETGPAADGVSPLWAQFSGGEAEPTTMVTDWIIDLDGNSKEFEESILRRGVFTEAPRVDDRYGTRKNRIGWALTRDVSRPSMGSEWIIADYNGVDRYDFESGSVSTLWLGSEGAPGEPIFIPRSRGAAEGDGWLMFHLLKDRGPGSEFIIIDAVDVAAGPIARIRLPYHSRPAIHGNWVAA